MDSDTPGSANDDPPAALSEASDSSSCSLRALGGSVNDRGENTAELSIYLYIYIQVLYIYTHILLYIINKYRKKSSLSSCESPENPETKRSSRLRLRVNKSSKFQNSGSTVGILLGTEKVFFCWWIWFNNSLLT